jgi:hypothetical protein
VWPKHVAPLIKPLLTPYCRKESCDSTVINKAYIVTLHNEMDTIKFSTKSHHLDIYCNEAIISERSFRTCKMESIERMTQKGESKLPVITEHPVKYETAVILTSIIRHATYV